MALLDINTGRITCDACETVIGQIDNHNGLNAILEINHFAPCGLPCACDGCNWQWIAGNAEVNETKPVAFVHTKTDCVQCGPKPCPICGGLGEVIHGEVTHNYFAISCPRCNGRGTIPGLDG